MLGIAIKLTSVHQTISGLAGLSPGPLAVPINLFTGAQSSFATLSHTSLVSNWERVGGRLSCLGISRAAARLNFDTPLVAGHGHFVIADHELTSGFLKFQLSGDGTQDARAMKESWVNFAYHFPEDVTGSYTYVQAKPSGDYAGSIDNVAVYDMHAVDPSQVACDVILIGGDGNASSTASEHVSAINRETPFDPRIWTMPALDDGVTYDEMHAMRHVPVPAIEPIIGTAPAAGMSPCHAAAAQLADVSDARGRPVLIMSLGSAGTGLTGGEEWRRFSTNPTTGARMWDEMVAMKASLDALGPDHRIVGCIWSLGAEDTSAEEYDAPGAWLDRITQFVGDVRTEIADVPMVLWRVGTHFEPLEGDGRGQRMGAAQNRLDQNSHDSYALDRFRVVTPQPGNVLAGSEIPYFNAAGMQANGRAAGMALRDMIQNPQPAVGPDPAQEQRNAVLNLVSQRDAEIDGPATIPLPTFEPGDLAVLVLASKSQPNNYTVSGDLSGAWSRLAASDGLNDPFVNVFLRTFEHSLVDGQITIAPEGNNPTMIVLQGWSGADRDAPIDGDPPAFAKHWESVATSPQAPALNVDTTGAHLFHICCIEDVDVSQNSIVPAGYSNFQARGRTGQCTVMVLSRAIDVVGSQPGIAVTNGAGDIGRNLGISFALQPGPAFAPDSFNHGFSEGFL